MVPDADSGLPGTERRTAGLELTSTILRTCITTLIVVLMQCCGVVEGGNRMVSLDNYTCQFAVYDISLQTSYSVSWDGRVLPRLCRLGFRVPNVNYYQICVSAAKYDVTDCGFTMQYYHGLSTQPNRNYTCTTPPVRYCVNSTRYFYLHFTAKQASLSHVTIDIIAKARQKSSQRSSSMMEVLVGGLASILFVGFSCFVFGARSKNPCLCLRKLFGQFDACRPCVTRMESNGCVPPQPEAPSSNRIPRGECCSHSACCILLGCAITGNVERTQGQTSGTTHDRADHIITDQSELDQPPPYNSLTTDGRSDPSEIIQPPPIWIQMSPPPYEAPPPSYEDIISNK
ncbi:uncharacterized protein LOC110467076 [Mizuhopecten yessoensis]|uniref:Uncharacterized protein n=1 Tax=Mizuhopecten yessoensis TaxID=6573 RepID=A0A210PMQ1_MIZYE|nr:uncharacterized protein LOC110467076 [Mizuhopecten yessoensis]OWF37768.1 hypothetical protein KP79_PYT12089 [Mizuhopecten yessoensis]